MTILIEAPLPFLFAQAREAYTESIQHERVNFITVNGSDSLSLTFTKIQPIHL